MSHYWYFSATLPGLLFGSPPPMSGGEFLARCALNLTPQDYAEIAGAEDSLKGALGPKPPRSGFLAGFAAWERTFRNELARLRARRSGRPEEEFLRPSLRSDEAGKAAALCFAFDDPYQAELSLERERWNAIERLSSLAAFDLDFLIAYRLKLSINERLARLDETAGKSGYRRLYGDIFDRAARTGETVTLGEKA